MLVGLSFCKGMWHSQTRIMAPVMAVSLVFGVIDAIKGAGLQWLPSWAEHLPLSEQGLAWLVPCVATLVVAVVCDRMLGKPREVTA